MHVINLLLISPVWMKYFDLFFVLQIFSFFSFFYFKIRAANNSRIELIEAAYNSMNFKCEIALLAVCLNRIEASEDLQRCTVQSFIFQRLDEHKTRATEDGILNHNNFLRIRFRTYYFVTIGLGMIANAQPNTKKFFFFHKSRKHC